MSAAYLAGRCDCPWTFMVQGVSLGRPGGMDQNQTPLTTFSHVLLKEGPQPHAHPTIVSWFCSVCHPVTMETELRCQDELHLIGN